MSIRIKLSIWFLLASLIPAVVIAIFAAREAGERFAGRAREELNQSQSSAEDALEQYRREISSRLSFAVERYTESIEKFDNTNIPDREAAELARNLNNELGLGLDYLDFIGENGFVYSSLRGKHLIGRTDPQWDEIAEISPGSIVVGPVRVIGEETFQDHLAIRSVLRHKRIVIIGGQGFDKSFLSRIRVAPRTRIFLLDRVTEEVLGESGDDEELRIASELKRRFLEGSEALQGLKELNLLAGSFYTHIVPLAEPPTETGENADSPGEIVILYPRKELDEAISSLLTTFILAAAVGTGLALILGIVISRRLASPLYQLNHAFNMVALGDFSYRLRRRRRDELGEMTDAFNRMAEDLGDLREQLIRAERVAAWQEVARKVAHEIKNPLSPIQVSIETLIKVWDRKHQDFDSIFQESTSMILEEVEKIRRIVSEFSDFARMPEPEFEITDLREVVRKALALCKPRLGQVTVNEQVSKVPAIKADPEHLHRMMMNLILNALEAMEGRGNLTVYLDHPEEDRRYVRLLVADDGPGMTEEVLQRIFTPYFTTKPGGTGLGLVITQRIVEQHQGRLSIQSSPGKGTVIQVLFPVV